MGQILTTEINNDHSFTVTKCNFKLRELEVAHLEKYFTPFSDHENAARISKAVHSRLLPHKSLLSCLKPVSKSLKGFTNGSDSDLFF